MHTDSRSAAAHTYIRAHAHLPPTHFCGVRGRGAASSFRHGCAAHAVARNKIDEKCGSLAAWRPPPHDYAHAHPQHDLTPIARPHHGRKERDPATPSGEVVICALCSCVKLYIGHSREKHGCFMCTSWRVELPILCMHIHHVSFSRTCFLSRIYLIDCSFTSEPVIKKPKLLDTASPSESPDSRCSQSSLYSSESTSSLESRNQDEKCNCFWSCVIARQYSTAEKRSGTVTVRSWYSRGPLEVRCWCASDPL